MEHQLVVFELEKEFYGLDIASVESIIKMQAITIVPHAPTYIVGVTNLRGNVLPVVDLRKRFGLSEGKKTADSRIVVAHLKDIKVGMVVDAVSEVLRINDEAIEPPPPMVTTVDSAFIQSIAKLDDKLVIMLDLSKVLSIKESE